MRFKLFLFGMGWILEGENHPLLTFGQLFLFASYYSALNTHLETNLSFFRSEAPKKRDSVRLSVCLSICL